MGEKKGTILVLNGVSSSGKTAIAKALQQELEEHYFWLSNDTFCDMCSSKYWESDWVTTINQALTAMFYTVRAFSDIGYNVIVDQVFLNNPTEGNLLRKCVEVLSEYPVFFIRVDCSLEDLEKRERERGDRDIGQAKSQLSYVHQHGLYDCKINTSQNSIAENVAVIRTLIESHISGDAFIELKRRLDQNGCIYEPLSDLTTA
jgi:chloramphenicol 3-O phosphotransferase